MDGFLFLRFSLCIWQRVPKAFTCSLEPRRTAQKTFTQQFRNTGALLFSSMSSNASKSYPAEDKMKGMTINYIHSKIKREKLETRRRTS